MGRGVGFGVARADGTSLPVSLVSTDDIWEAKCPGGYSHLQVTSLFRQRGTVRRTRQKRLYRKSKTTLPNMAIVVPVVVKLLKVVLY